MIVVIGILAAITLVAYNGIQGRAWLAATQSDLENAAKTLETNKLAVAATSGVEGYPAASLTTDFSGLVSAGVKLSNGSAFTAYIVNNATNPANYCLTITNNNQVYSVSSTSSAPIQGTCVTNLVANPQPVGTGAGIPAGWNSNWYGGGTATGNYSYADSAVTKVWTSISGIANGEVFMGAGTLGPITPGVTYTATVQYMLQNIIGGTNGYVQPRFQWYNSSGSLIQTDVASTTFTVNSMNNQWVTVATTGTAPANAATANYIPFGQGSYGWIQVGTKIIVKNLLFGVGSKTVSFGNGSSSGWYWTGAPNASTSAGPVTIQ